MAARCVNASSAVVPDQLAVLDPAAGSSSEIQTMSASASCYGTSLLNTTLQATPESRGTKEPPADLARLTEYTEVLINRSSGPVQLSTINRLRTELDAIPMDVRDIGCVVKVYGFAGTGTLRFVGKHHVTGDPRFGVEFDGPRGEHDGATGEPAHRYFRCDPGHGVLRHPRTVRRATAEEASSVAISDEVAALVSQLHYEVPEYALGPCHAPNDMGNVDIGTEAVQPDYADPVPGSGVCPLPSRAEPVVGANPGKAGNPGGAAANMEWCQPPQEVLANAADEPTNTVVMTQGSRTYDIAYAPLDRQQNVA